MLFTHRGHSETVNDLRWHPVHADVLASIADDGSVQVWKVSETLFKDDQVDDGVLE